MIDLINSFTSFELSFEADISDKNSMGSITALNHIGIIIKLLSSNLYFGKNSFIKEIYDLILSTNRINAHQSKLSQ